MTNASFADLAVLVVDDNKDMRGLLEGIVREFGVRSIESARDGASALSAMVAKPVGLVLCDIQMKPMNGLEFVKTVRLGHLGIDRSVPIILLTAHSEVYRVKEAGLVGADEFVTKPVSAAMLHDRMLSVITKPQSSLVAARQENAARIDGSNHTAAAGPHPGDDGRAAAERAQAVVAKLAGAYMDRAGLDIEALGDAYARAVADPAERGAQIDQIAALAHDIEGQGGSFGYPLMSAIGASLSKFCRAAKRCEDDQLELIKTHIDAMKAVIVNRLEGSGGAHGAELIGLLRIANEKRRT